MYDIYSVYIYIYMIFCTYVHAYATYAHMLEIPIWSNYAKDMKCTYCPSHCQSFPKQ